ncbi:UNVERIFIED_CONTAM: hypothetical protein Cloal_4320 [Acetivibrio alkalicellulosi]
MIGRDPNELILESRRRQIKIILNHREIDCEKDYITTRIRTV